MNIITNRLVIREIDYEQTKEIREENMDNDLVHDHFASLNQEELAVAMANTEAVSHLISRMKRSIGTENINHYGAWSGDKMVGYISISDENANTPELQIEIAPQFQGQGYGYEFGFALLKYLFERKQYEYVQYTVLPNNTASVKLVEKLGAVLQPPNSEIEKLLIRTYHISKFQ